ncbi:MAG: VTT domain-containing protein [Sulfurifustaceae bacterium]
MTRYAILKPGYNCWRIARAQRVAFLIDAAAYFRAFRAAAARTQRNLLMIGWDIDSRVRLVRDEPPSDGLPVTLCEFLNAIVSRPHGPHAFVLTWDFAMLYALDREWLPLYKLDWRTHRRLHFRMDSEHPPGGSHHQKVIVIDDRLAFVGGLDLTRARWDTPEHRPGDPRRVDVGYTAPYRPFHDVQVMLEGEIAPPLGELVRDRWHRATGRALAPSPAVQGDSWPADVVPDVENVDVAIARTDPAFGDRAEVREVELLYRDAIRAARRHIYIENQFFTANAVADALERRLQEPDGPEVVMVVALRTDGWLSRQTMDVLRDRTVYRLRQADRYGRLRVYYPDQPGLAPQCINVHSKVMVIDNDFARVGSANLNNRSMGFDTECDVALESGGDPAIAAGIARLRNRLLAEHLGTEPETVGQAIAREGSLTAAIDRLRGGRRTLKELGAPSREEVNAWLPNPELLDPERPIDPAKLTEEFIPAEEHAPTHRRVVLAVATLVAVLLLAAAWKWTPLREWLDIDVLTRYVSGLRDYPGAPLLVIGAFILGGFIVVPVTLLVIATAFAFGPLQGFVYSLIGGVASAVLLYGVGRSLGRDTVRRFAGKRLNRLSRRLGERGVLAVALVRMLPVAPFTVVNLVAGASHIRLRDFVIGTLIGMGPGMLMISLFVDRVGATIQNPGLGTGLLLAAILALIFLGTYALKRWVLGRDKQGPGAERGMTSA